MSPAGNRTAKWREWAVIVALATACLVLALLQYRWTGELSVAESQRLYGTAAGRVQQFTRAFDMELRQSVAEFVPGAAEVRTRGALLASEERARNASQGLDRPVFRRVGAVIPDTSRKLRFYEWNLKGKQAQTAELGPTESPWPSGRDWQTLRAELQALALGDGPGGPIVDARSALIETPVFLEGIEQLWVVFELDTDYAARVWLPELAKTFLNPEGDEVFRPSVRWNESPETEIFGDGGTSTRFDAQASFFPVRYLGRGGGPRGDPGLRGDPGPPGDRGRWRIRLSHAEGSVPGAVTAARWRNLAIAMVPLLLIAVAGVALVQNSRRAQRLAAAQYQFFAGISHELRTPLTVIQGAGHNLLSGIVKDDRQRENYARAIVKESTQLSEMVDQLLSYGVEKHAPVSAEITAEAAKGSLGIAISEAIEGCATELEQSLRAVDVDMPPDLPLVRGDAITLRRVFGNLISNAIRHGGGEVDVTAVRAGSMVEIRVADSGEGIAADELAQVFDPFFRGKRARTGRTRGTGLGLSLVKQIVERLGGNVSVESQVGKGTVFLVRLPVAE